MFARNGHYRCQSVAFDVSAWRQVCIVTVWPVLLRTCPWTVPGTVTQHRALLLTPGTVTKVIRRAVRRVGMVQNDNGSHTDIMEVLHTAYRYGADPENNLC
jgi:hypothetical protein